MAVTDWPQQWAYNTMSSGTTYTMTAPLTVWSASTNPVPAPRPQTALEWLDAEVEAVCELARQAG